ncbi:ABC transporter ATP-binding protein [Phyllobacterium brassicacearum]|uniref:ABC transporter ATP-binding protein n=1 Tax=Phyllobacterium brassicacearum TaxID=314235 RepID=A0A2P7BAA2_9HYPH|nr:ABC transporter ATP-binding protein [Phyllobacterium brassicacearum]PSH63391.1 ABC transporter ATP-binding protein [Phyllobacterium brassicacearum]TDQ18032.1 amino acid/amide ABC transporter ATP-binding protein 2 (HAAT family) [Phyllobacterium brassicacearum]
MTLTAEQVAESLSKEADDALLSINNVEVIFNGVILVLRGISLNARKGKITALLGANGAGKSTTLKAIAGLLRTDDGEITRGSVTYDGRDVTHTPPDRKVRDGVFLVMEGRGIIQDMTIRDNLRLGAFTRPGANVETEIEEIYRFFPRLKERKGLAGYLSGGEQQMLAIGRAMMAKPRLIMMDEPSMGLSPLLVKEVFGIIRRLNRELGISILLVEQNANMALKISDYGYIMENGKIVLDGSAEELLQNEDVKEFYLGGGEERRSFLNVKSFRRRKRWL